jgi:hypothetical protein
MTARVAPDGEWLAFMSDRELTGYDNHDVATGKPDEEVYLYNAVAGRLSCASCDPSGARPVGALDNGEPGPLIDPADTWKGRVAQEGRWLAANVPGWTPYRLSTARYQSRYLSNSGRLFFNAHPALVPSDVNGTWDVYEYEPEGLGSCTSSTSSGSDVFKPARAVEVEGREVEEGAGCVGLISSGESKDESAFLDASATGDRDGQGDEGGGDVFFLTTAQLAPQDVDDSYDVYDAHECTAASSCTRAPVGPPPCENEASCKPSPEPQPTIFGPSGSATFSGAGNLSPPPPSGKSTVKTLTRAQKLAKALKACRAKKDKRKRVACEAQARKKYGAAKAKRSSHGKGSK